MNVGALARPRTSASVTVVSSTAGLFDASSFHLPSVSAMPPSPAWVWNFTVCPDTLDTTSLIIWQVRPSICVGKGSTQMPVQPSSSSAFVFDPIVPCPEPTSRKWPLVTPGNIFAMTHLSCPISEGYDGPSPIASCHVRRNACTSERSQHERLAWYCLRISAPRGLPAITATAATTTIRTTRTLRNLTLTIVLILFRSYPICSDFMH